MQHPSSPWLVFFAVFLSASSFGCSSNGDPSAPCRDGSYSCGQLCTSDTPPPACGLDCSSAGCPVGFYCADDETCTADCSGAGDRMCGDGTCTSSGVCMEPGGVDAGPRDQGPPPDFGPLPDFGPVPDQGDGVCARVTVEATRVTPNVIFLVDRSGSMAWELDLSDGAQCPVHDGHYNCYANNQTQAMRNRSRWRGLRSTLVGTSAAPADEGLIASLDDQVRFGFVTYTRATGACRTMNILTPVTQGNQTRVNVIQPSAIPTARDVIAGNGSNDNRYLNLEPSGGTPTGPAIDFVLSRLASGVRNSTDPTILILATDGDPTHSNNCSNLTHYTNNPEAWAVSAVQRAYSAGIRTFVLGVADETELAEAHVNELANAGVGAAPSASPAAPSWRVQNVAALHDALSDIIGAEISCTIELAGMVPTWSTDPCAGGTIDLVEGAVRTPLECAPGNGWQLTGPSTVEIMGSACLLLKAATNGTLDASFPCDTVIFG